LAELGAKAGVDGLIASPQEVKTLRAELGDDIKIVVAGVRPKWAKADDQKRVMTPRQALDAGADYLVIGRPITSYPNPREAVTKVLEELSA
jgi:orotidine-5'-phosphate decarboxylase